MSEKSMVISMERKSMDHNLMDRISMDQLPYGLRCELLDAYGQLIAEKMDQGYKGYLLTFMSNHIPGNQQTVTRIMTRDVQCFYENLITRVVRKSRTARDHKLPIFIASRDRPVRKWTKQSLEDVTINNGLHFHGALLIPARARKDWYRKLDPEKIKAHSHIRNIHREPISSRPRYTAGYALKRLKYDADAHDNILILPVSRSELPPKQPREPKAPRERMHW
jgi:hypothetical protein